MFLNLSLNHEIMSLLFVVLRIIKYILVSSSKVQAITNDSAINLSFLEIQ